MVVFIYMLSYFFFSPKKYLDWAYCKHILSNLRVEILTSLSSLYPTPQ